MKRLLISAIIFIAVCIFIFLAFTFANWDINPKNWKPIIRTIFAMFSSIIPLMFSFFYYINTEDDE